MAQEIPIDNLQAIFTPDEPTTTKIPQLQIPPELVEALRKAATVQEARQHKWDLRYLDMARYVSLWSKDPSTKAGAIIVRPNNIVASMGFNGFPQGMNDDPKLYANREEKYSRVVHCEVNAILHTQNLPFGSTLYTWPFSCCDRCMVQMIQGGIRRFVFPEPSKDVMSRWADSINRAKNYAGEVNADWVEISRKELGLE